MKKLLFILLLLPLRILAQDTLHIPAPVGKAIVQQLVSCDSVKAIHELTKEQLSLTEKKVEVQDSMIVAYKNKVTMFREMLNNQEQKFKVQKNWTEDLRKENRNLRIVNKIYKTGFWSWTGIFVGGAIALYFIK